MLQVKRLSIEVLGRAFVSLLKLPPHHVGRGSGVRWVGLAKGSIGNLSPAVELLDTRQRLIDSAVEVVSTPGEAALRLSEIATKVGVKQPSIYHFFSSREDLVVEVCREMYRWEVEPATSTFEYQLAHVKTLEILSMLQRKNCCSRSMNSEVKCGPNPCQFLPNFSKAVGSKVGSETMCRH